MILVVDLSILLIISACILFGYKKGLVGVAFSIVSFIVSIVIAFILFTPISNFIINNTQIDNKIETIVMKKFSDETNAKVEINKEDINNTSEIVVNYINEYANEVKDSGSKIIGQRVAKAVIDLVSMIVVFIVTKIVLLLFKSIIEGIAKLPLIKQFDKAGGIVYGTLKGIVIIYVILAIISLIAPLSSSASLIEMINNSYLGGVMYNNNLLLKMIL